MGRVRAQALLAVMVALSALSCGDDVKPAADARVPTCAEQQAALDAFVAANQACDTVADCAVAGFVRWDCNHGTDFVVAVTDDAEDEAQRRLDAMQSCLPVTVDDFDEPILACEGGRCLIADEHRNSCFPLPDASVDAATSDAGTDGGL